MPRHHRQLFACSLIPALLLAQSYAQEEIAHRKADLTVHVQTPSGSPLQGAEVQIEMLNHAFRFGTAVEAGHLEPENGNFDEWTANEVEKYFNSVTFGNVMKWSYFEDRTPERMLQILGHAQSYNAFGGPDKLRVRGHATLWGASYQVPSDVRSSNDPNYIRDRILGHVEDYHTAFKGAGIDNFDLYNEHFHESELLIDKLVPDQDLFRQAAEVAAWFNKAKEADPDAVLFINDYNMLNFWQENDSDVIAYKEFVDAVRDAGGQIDGIGLQGHMDRMITKAQLKRRFDLLSAPMPPSSNHPDGLPGLRLEVTELDINNQWWTAATDQDQATVTANVLQASFEHPSVDGVTMWGMNDFHHWRDNAILYDDLEIDGNTRTRVEPTVKQSGQVWIDHVTGEWWEDHSGSSSPTGQYTANTFKGTHRVTVTLNGETQEKIVHLDEADTVAFAFAAEAADAATYDAWAAFVEWGDANPARDADPDGDGRDNFEEFVFGTDPLAADHAPAARLHLQPGGVASLEFSMRAANAGIEVIPQYSTDLVEWKFAGLTTQEAIQSATPIVADNTATYLVLLPDALDTSFYRLKFTEAAIE